MFLSVVDKHAPFKKKRIKNKKSPWMTAELKKLLIMRDRLKSVAVKSGDSNDWLNYRKERNNCNNLPRKAKSDYYHNYIHTNSGNSKEIWKAINQLTSRNIRSDNNISKLIIGTRSITDQADIAEHLNKHFVGIGPELASSLDESNNLFTDYIKPVATNFSLKCITPSTVFKLLASVSEKKATGLDGIPSKLIKEAASVIAVPLCDIFNLSIQTSIFPSDWKLAKVIPIHKGDAKDVMNNYRPISVLSTIAKVFERIVYNQLYEYVTENNILSQYQAGFRPNQ